MLVRKGYLESPHQSESEVLETGFLYKALGIEFRGFGLGPKCRFYGTGNLGDS